MEKEDRVRSNQPATGLRNKELSKGQTDYVQAEVSIVFNSAGRLVGRIAFCRLSFLSLSSLSKVGSSQTFGLLQAGLRFLAGNRFPVVVSSFLTDPIGCS